jgi:ABC-2 type transport system permease protein
VLATSLIMFAAMIFLAERLFYKGAIGLNETSGRRRLLTRDEMSRRVSSGRRASSAIFMREFRIMNRTPVFLLNGLLNVVILPAFFVLTTRTGSRPPDAEIHNLIASGGALWLLALFMIVCSSLNGISSSAFSREGAQFWISELYPSPKGAGDGQIPFTHTS